MEINATIKRTLRSIEAIMARSGVGKWNKEDVITSCESLSREAESLSQEQMKKDLDWSGNTIIKIETGNFITVIHIDSIKHMTLFSSDAGGTLRITMHGSDKDTIIDTSTKEDIEHLVEILEKLIEIKQLDYSERPRVMQLII
jgi:DNA polymerase III delta prime subunit